ncbi:TetR/AcrR family transcriptional regulator [Nocardia sp. NPDC059177]|uniref:TetR/AcrR family transcriptional regulator n=1 Tax=Nocardia sp. NPDC059177 TaxID=3346759 RepID=UPI0036AACFA3
MSRSYGGISAADRVAERRTRLLGAGVDIIGTQGVSALAMRLVCREAGLSQKFFYESFADIDALMHAVYQATVERLVDAVHEQVGAGDLAGAYDAAARLMEADPRVCRILLVEPVADARLRIHVREVAPAIAERFFGDLLRESPDGVPGRLRFSGLFGALISLFVEWTEGNLGTDRDQFVRHLVEVTHTLTTAGTRSVGSGADGAVPSPNGLPPSSSR